MASLDHLRESARANPAHIERTAIAVVALAVMLGLGIMAHRRLQPIQKQAAVLRSANETVARFRRSYRAPTPAESGRWEAGAETLGLSVDRGSRLPLAQTIARLGETAGLREVRVRFSTLDSLYVPTRTVGASAGISPADYSVVVDCRGSFGALLDLVNGLPSSVSVVLLTSGAAREAARPQRDNGDAHYHITLAVYEAANASQAN
jgi:hypothetical protein